MSNQLTRNHTILEKYIPQKAVPVVVEWVYKFDFKLKIKKSRSTKFGDYRPPYNGSNHQITINHNMNQYAFLITLIHEVAHLHNYNKHKDRVKPHGEEWKECYKLLMAPFLTTEIFPEEIIQVLNNYMKNPAASSCSDIELLRALKRHDKNQEGKLLEELIHGAVFIYNSRQFVRGEKVRKRYKCLEVKTKNVYLFSPLTEVETKE